MKTTGFSRVSKDIVIKELEKELKARPSFFIAQHGTISATALDKLRAKLRQTNTRYFVVKNSLGKKALEKANLKQFSDSLSGSCGIAFTSGDIVASSKALVDFSKENETFKIQNAYFNGEMVGVDKVKVLASLPSKEVLIARVVGGIQTPISRFVGVLSGTLRSVVTALDAIAKKKAS
jgi:large subunit ribosomal protein L10